MKEISDTRQKGRSGGQIEGEGSGKEEEDGARTEGRREKEIRKRMEGERERGREGGKGTQGRRDAGSQGGMEGERERGSGCACARARER